MSRVTRLPLCLLVVALAAAGCGGGSDDPSQNDPDAGGAGQDGSTPQDCSTPADCAAVAEQKASDRLQAIAAAVSDPEQDQALTNFLRDVPKGGDLHNHLSGAVYAETYLDWASSEGGYCIVTSDNSLSYKCGSGTVPIPAATDPLFGRVIAAWSMEGFQPSASESGHDHFFATFGKFGAISGSGHHGKMLANVMQRADEENEVYLEPMLVSNSKAGSLGQTVWSNAHGSASITAADFDSFRKALLADSSWDSQALQPIRTDISKSEDVARSTLGCDSSNPQSACRVATRYAVYISRSGNTAGVFAQMVAAYEAANQESRLVALNLVGPEDGVGALKTYDIEMSMLQYLQETYAGKSPLRVTLHAGELAAKYMPSGYSISSINHIRKAVEIAHAERIGHGLDVMSESNPQDLIQELKAKKIAVEVCLSSNIQILEVSGTAHPLATYLSAGVPVTLATDDQAVSRSTIAGEYRRAVLDQKLDYRQLKALARNSLEYSFLPGASLWSAVESATPVSACAATDSTLPGDEQPSADCASFLSSSARAKAQWELEKRFRSFESHQ